MFIEIPYQYIQYLKRKNNNKIFTALLATLTKKPFENLVGKGENAGNQHFLLFLQCFLPFPKQFSIYQSLIFCRLQVVSIWTSLKFHRLIKSQRAALKISMGMQEPEGKKHFQKSLKIREYLSKCLSKGV